LGAFENQRLAIEAEIEEEIRHDRIDHEHCLHEIESFEA